MNDIRHYTQTDCIHLNPEWYDSPCQGYPESCYRCRDYETDFLKGVDERLNVLEGRNPFSPNLPHELEQLKSRMNFLEKKYNRYLDKKRGGGRKYINE